MPDQPSMPYKDKAEHKEAQRRHYRQNKTDYKDRQTEARDRNRRYLWQYLQNKACKICGEQDPIVLEFDHRDPSTKEESIAICAVNRKFGLKRLQKELDKCDILCANCHRRKSAHQLGFNKLKY